MADAPAITPLGATTLNRDWRIDVDSGASGTPIAGATQATTGIITTTAPHGLVVGQTVTPTGSNPGGFTVGTTYYVVGTPTSTTFTLSATSGGTAIAAATAGAFTGTRGPSWITVRGRTDFKPSIDSKLQDDSDMDSLGWMSQTRTAAQWKLELKLRRAAVGAAVAGASSSYDPGQEVLRLAGDQVGPYNSVLARWYKLGAVRTEAYQGFAAVDWSPDGGDMAGLDTATVTLTGQGPRISITHPFTLP